MGNMCDTMVLSVRGIGTLITLEELKMVKHKEYYVESVIEDGKWLIQVFDDEGNEIEYTYAKSKIQKNYLIQYFTDKYSNIDES